MKIIFPLLFVLMGCLFLSIGTVFYPAITRWLIGAQGSGPWSTPHFWDLSLVLRTVRVIFLVVGAFLTLFGAIMLVTGKTPIR